MSHDLVVRGGVVVDGTGAPGRVADVAVRDGRIVAIGTVDDDGVETIDATGRVVAPGFIDLHTHYDAQLLWDPAATPSPLHGVTTVLGGNCGFTIAPLAEGDADYIRQMMAVVEGMPLASLEAGPAWDWQGFDEWLDRLDGAIAVNAGFLVGHSTIRRAVMGDAAVTDEADADQVEAMATEVHRAIEAGALGFSSSWGEAHRDGDGHLVPSLAAHRDELVALAAAAGDHDGTTLEFIPCVGEIPEDRMALMADMAAAAGRPLNWNLLGSLSPVEIYEQQLAASDVAADRGATVVALALPDVMRLRMGPVLDALTTFAEVAARADRPAAPGGGRPRHAGPACGTRRSGPASGPLAALADGSLVEIAESDHWGGRTLAEVAAAAGVDTVDVLIDVVLIDGLALTMVLPTLVPSLGRHRRGLGRPGRGLAGPPGPPRRFGRRRPRRHDVPRQLPHRRPGRGRPGAGPADPRGGRAHDVRRAGPALRAEGPGPPRRRGPRRPGGLRPGHGRLGAGPGPPRPPRRRPPPLRRGPGRSTTSSSAGPRSSATAR